MRLDEGLRSQWSVGRLWELRTGAHADPQLSEPSRESRGSSRRFTRDAHWLTVRKTLQALADPSHLDLARRPRSVLEELTLTERLEGKRP